MPSNSKVQAITLPETSAPATPPLTADSAEPEAQHLSQQDSDLLSLSTDLQALLDYHQSTKPTDDIGCEKFVINIHQLADTCSEMDFSGLADLFTLYAEFIQQMGEDAFTLRREVVQQLHQAMSALIQAPSQQTVDSVTGIMTSKQWSDPLPEEDVSFLNSLLSEDSERLATVLMKQKSIDQAKESANNRDQRTGIYEISQY